VAANERRILRCAVYTRKSSEHGLEQDFNSLDAQREAAEAYVKSQAHEGWRLVKARYDDGGLSGGTLERPALQKKTAVKAVSCRTAMCYPVCCLRHRLLR
jgi:site-specific DNA recombinase